MTYKYSYILAEYAACIGEDCNPTLDGHQYRGHTSVTESGKQCQAWASQSPHKHKYTNDSLFPDGSVIDASNYCRNPENSFKGTWCYTTDPGTAWEKCDVPVCGTTNASEGWFHVNLCRNKNVISLSQTCPIGVFR